MGRNLSPMIYPPSERLDCAYACAYSQDKAGKKQKHSSPPRKIGVIL